MISLSKEEQLSGMIIILQKNHFIGKWLVRFYMWKFLPPIIALSSFHLYIYIYVAEVPRSGEVGMGVVLRISSEFLITQLGHGTWCIKLNPRSHSDAVWENLSSSFSNVVLFSDKEGILKDTDIMKSVMHTKSFMWSCFSLLNSSDLIMRE